MTSDTHLRAVSDSEYDVEPGPAPAPSGSGLPKFEGQDVEFTRLKLTSVSDLEVGEDAYRIDDIVRLFVEGRIVRVDHVVDEKSGQLKRMHTIKVVDAIPLPWDFTADRLQQ